MSTIGGLRDAMEAKAPNLHEHTIADVLGDVGEMNLAVRTHAIACPSCVVG